VDAWLPGVALLLGALACALAPRRAAWTDLVALAAPALALGLVALAPGASGPLRALEVTLLAGALAAGVLGQETGAAPRAHAPLLAATAGLLLLGRAQQVEVVAAAWLLATLPLVWSLLPTGNAGRFLGSTLVGGGLVVVGLGLLVAATDAPRLDLVALPVLAGEDLASAARLAALGVVLAFVGATHLMAAPPVATPWAQPVHETCPPPLAAWLATCGVAAVAALGLRVLGALLTPSGRLILPDVEPGAVLAAAGVLVILGARLAARRETDLGRLLGSQAAATGGWVLLALGALAAPSSSGGDHAARALALLAVAALLGQVGGAALVAASDRELGGRGLERWVGAGRRNRALSVALTVHLANLGGAPPTLGFLARLFVLVAALEGGYGLLALVAAIDVALGVALALRVARVVLLTDPPPEPFGPPAVEPLVTTPGLTVLAVVLALLSVALGLLPAGLLRAMEAASAGI
jgi:NADH-quinone oxidoreductase subunit N